MTQIQTPLSPGVHRKMILAAAVFLARRGSFPPTVGERLSSERGLSQSAARGQLSALEKSHAVRFGAAAASWNNSRSGGKCFTRHLTPALSPNSVGGEGETFAASVKNPAAGLAGRASAKSELANGDFLSWGRG